MRAYKSLNITKTLGSNLMLLLDAETHSEYTTNQMRFWINDRRTLRK
jgi:hypothetical protein